MEYVTLHKVESYGNRGGFGLEIKVAADHLPDLKQDSIKHSTYKAVRIIESEVQAAIIQNDPKTSDRVTENRKLIQLFPEPIFVEEIPNQYCSDWCCRHLPWFVVTTVVGRFTIGWRKRVINIDWSETVGTQDTQVLFSNEDVTKGDKYIHAWSLEDAKKYIECILENI